MLYWPLSSVCRFVLICFVLLIDHLCQILTTGTTFPNLVVISVDDLFQCSTGIVGLREPNARKTPRSGSKPLVTLSLSLATLLEPMQRYTGIVHSVRLPVRWNRVFCKGSPSDLK